MDKSAVAFTNLGSRKTSSESVMTSVFSRDHKVIGKQYFFLSLSAVLIGSLLSLLMRIHLVWPQASIPFFGQIKPEGYLGFLTIHGTFGEDGQIQQILEDRGVSYTGDGVNES